MAVVHKVTINLNVAESGRKIKQATKTPNGLKTAMTVSSEEEKTNKSLTVDLQYAQTPDDTPDP